MEPVVHLRGAVALLGRFPALAGVDLDVAPREVVLLEGPNGAGKTTLLRVLAGLVPLTGGSGSVLGCDLRTQAGALRAQVGLLSHASGLYDDLSVEANVSFWTRASRARPEDAAASMARLGLDGRLSRVAVGRLSAGQRQRTALAILVARRPLLWLLDEPHAGLDAGARTLVDSILLDAADAGATVVLASHEREHARALAGRVVHLDGGATEGAAGIERATDPPVEPPRPQGVHGVA